MTPVTRSARVLLIALAALAACSPATVSPPDGGGPDASIDGGRDAAEPDAGAWEGWPACDPSATTQRLTFVHVNDLHANYTPEGVPAVSRWARIRHFYERTRVESPYTIFTDGGDDCEKGSVAELLSAGRSTRELVVAMGFDVRVIGNHDFAWSFEETLALSNDPHAVVLSGNHHVVGEAAARWGAEEWHVIPVGCVRVGFVGLTSEPWDERDRPISEPFYASMTASYDYVAEARRILDAHVGEADVIVFVDHIGQSQDEALARAVPEIDIVLSGHSHTFTPAPVSAGSALVIQSGSFARYVVRLDVDVDLTSHEVTFSDYVAQTVGTEPPSAALEATVEATMASYAPEATTTIGTLEHSLDNPAVADLEARAAVSVHGADAALLDVDTVWSVLFAGALTPQRCVDAFEVERERPGTPGFNSLFRVTVSGEVLGAIAALAEAQPERWRFVGPSAITPTGTYDLVLQKRAAFHPDEELGAGIVLSTTPEPLEEAWETLDAFARARTAACLHVDTDTALPGCAP